MPRRSRKDAPGRLHHIMNRGIAKRVVFPDHAAKQRFILLLACSVRRGELEVESFCVMDTHFHLLARSPAGRIDYPMMRVLNSYARYFNRRFRRDGPVFRGRYRSWPVMTVAYWRVLVRYIDFNPVKAGICHEPAEYRYGSARLYALRRAGPRWLARATVEGHVMSYSSEIRYQVFSDGVCDHATASCEFSSEDSSCREEAARTRRADCITS